MTRTIDIPTFQAAVVRNCSPTLAGIKPASLFTYPGTYAHRDGSTTTEAIAERRARLLNVIAQCNRELDPLGIHLSVLVWRPCGALVYVYRAKASPPISQTLAPKRRSPRKATTRETFRHALCIWHHASRSRAITSRNAPVARLDAHYPSKLAAATTAPASFRTK